MKLKISSGANFCSNYFENIKMNYQSRSLFKDKKPGDESRVGTVSARRKQIQTNGATI